MFKDLLLKIWWKNKDGKSNKNKMENNIDNSWNDEKSNK